MIYRLLKLNHYIKNHRIKFLGLYLLHIFRQRYLAINLDPVLACNLRCKMCYFTDKEYVKKLKGVFTEEQMQRVAKVSFKRALKLQIGCGTEPTLYKDLPAIVKLGKKYKVPYISLTTNANLLTEEKIEELLRAGLNEFTISLHGVTKQSYEHFMHKGDYDKFMNAFRAFAKLKKQFDFVVRINYTFNKDNFYELADFFDHFDPASFDVLQVRPIRKLGDTEYNDFDISSLEVDYEKMHQEILASCKTNEITLLAPKSIKPQSQKVNPSSIVFDYTYCYISPQHVWREDFKWTEETYDQYAKRTGWSAKIFSNIFKSKERVGGVDYKLNYDVDIN